MKEYILHRWTASLALFMLSTLIVAYTLERMHKRMKKVTHQMVGGSDPSTSR